jgi:hypothetical protein
MNGTKISAILANLLVMLGEVHQAEIPKLLEATVETGIPLGRILVICRRLTEDELHSALTAARLVLHAQVSIHKAAMLLAYSYLWHVPFGSVWQRPEFKEADTVAVLLIASGFLETSKVLAFAGARKAGGRIGGRELYRAGLISLYQWQETLGQALLVKHCELSLRQVLCEAEGADVTGDLPVVDCEEVETMRLGHLLLQAGLVAEEELLYALELGLESGEALGQILVRQSAITALELKTILKLQGLIHARSITPAEAVNYLKLVPQTRAIQSRNIQERAMQSRTKQERAIQSRTIQSRTIQSRTIQSRTIQERIIQEPLRSVA